ncbi:MULTISPECIES: bifunctional adenosylcobinamide kinase/adenosylcobinamide-phosphate guanylyltransferase [unclassified Candidatus Frackibacter]|uniref:bifunctional adenosylcobinamide kinase/adenosylcobinamide-phosphate guanylyltransferase n=1 Tax=unclassified Candidatus Frackibacter TaxID=2648818 RepID=UPI0007973686|nr:MULTISPECIES: bifunctional adenosylcobinamide kinase/adenosylcobinamide-phosphate guanylyltransferase [unclassified Candidatus Frackibacter]KXS43882.1 MAG: adenosylcobinamide kinase / adenosylcobinamide-phosphate guanylyltransferase [Candidatus Frackibacter sp. T328-2]SDC33822.1 adenosylcobinamide kinase /adenosylcobinamide-phosphate guanylyltransferase [Candidatus Frackibacter sp. WG11]SEM57365.1 adenosylcobinamide kinase /adenosylcobinamide-phosphate guanylyltransferase [Candidatus Frackiba
MGDSTKQSVLVLGGARSGKSSFAEDMAYNWGQEDVTYIATAEAGDEEMKERIQKHQESRPSTWKTVEETKDVASRIINLAQETEVILLDCLTVLVSNLLLQGEDFGTEDYEFVNGEEKAEAALTEIERLANNLKQASANIIIVSNEVGQGLVPPYPLSRVYRDTVGRANQIIAQVVDEVYITYAGLPVEIKELGRANKAKFRGQIDGG